MNKDEEKYFKKMIDILRKKILAQISDMRLKAIIMADIGTVSKDINDFSFLLELLYDPGLDRDIDLKHLSDKLAESGFINEARVVATRITHAPTAFEAWIQIALMSGNGSDFQTVSKKIESLEFNLKQLNEPDVMMERKIRKAKKKLIDALQEAERYDWAMCLINEMEHSHSEDYFGETARKMIRKAYQLKEVRPEVSFNKERFDKLPAAFDLAAENGYPEDALEVIFLLLAGGEMSNAVNLIENLDESKRDRLYIKSRGYLEISRYTQSIDDLKKSALYAMKMRHEKHFLSDERAVGILTEIGVGARSPYYLGIAIDLAIAKSHSLSNIHMFQRQIAHVIKRIAIFKEDAEKAMQSA